MMHIISLVPPKDVHISLVLSKDAHISFVTTTKTGSLDVLKLSREGSLDGFKTVVEVNVKKGKVLDGSLNVKNSER